MIDEIPALGIERDKLIAKLKGWDDINVSYDIGVYRLLSSYQKEHGKWSTSEFDAFSLFKEIASWCDKNQYSISYNIENNIHYVKVYNDRKMLIFVRSKSFCESITIAWLKWRQEIND